MRLTWVYLLGWSIGCGSSNASNAIDALGSIDVMASDARPVDATRICDPLAKFGIPMPVTELAATTMLGIGPHLTLTSDELALYLVGITSTGGGPQLYAAHRSAVTERFEDPNLLPAVQQPAFDPTVSSDGLNLWFASDRGQGTHLYFSTRATTSDDFSTPVLDPYVNSTSGHDRSPFLTADGQQLWFTSNRPLTPEAPQTTNAWHATREGRSFTTPRVEAAFGPTPQATYSDPVLSADRLTIYVARLEFASGNQSIWRSHRSTVHDPFPAPTPVDELNVRNLNTPGWLSADNCRMFLTSGYFSYLSYDIYTATRLP